MTLDPIHHDWFDRLEIWFEAVVSDFKFSESSYAKHVQDGIENTYVIRAKGGHRLGQCKTNPITFQTTTDIALPNPEYLRIHAACCKVALLSGATEHMDKILEDLEDMQVLSKDGSSAHVLAFALQPFSQEVLVL